MFTKRVLITLLAVLVGLLSVAAFIYSFTGSEGRRTPTTATTTGPGTVADIPAAPDGATPAPPDRAPRVDDDGPPLGGLRLADGRAGAEVDAPLVLGSVQADTPFLVRVALTRRGAGIEQIALAHYKAEVHARNDEHPYILARPVDVALQRGVASLIPLAAQSVTINGQTLSLYGHRWSASRVSTLADGSQRVTLRAEVETAAGQPVLRVLRAYTLRPGSYDLSLQQRVENLSNRSLKVAFSQYGPADAPGDDAEYMGDRRQFALGYFNLDADPQKTDIWTVGSLIHRSSLVQSIDAKGGQPLRTWPYAELEVKAELVWLAAENRYFAIVVHPLIPPSVKKTADVPPLEAMFPDVSAVAAAHQSEDVARRAGLDPASRAVAMKLTTAPFTLAAGEGRSLDLGIFAGPREQSLFSEAPYSLLNFDSLIRYELGCTYCTFQPIARFLLWFLEGIHFLVRDWGVAIIILVGCVRLLLHPITKKAQVNMMKMGKGMQAMQPEMEKLKAKYADDPTKLNAEMMQLYREKGVNPAGALGCLPLFLQTPIWIALYAMLYLAIELRHQPAFYGVFQHIGAMFGGWWPFLADLSSPDRFIVFFDEPQPIHLLLINFDYSSLNVLPLLWAVVLFFQQKLMTPPAANEQAAQQQKMMRYMMLLMPLFLYSAPSGLTLYILASTGAGMLDSYLVRKHIKEAEERGDLLTRKPVKPGGFRDRMQTFLAQKQASIAQQQEEAKKAATRRPPKQRKR